MRRSLLVFVGATSFVSPAFAASRGETYTCHFGRYGKMTIDTREPGGSITLNGKRRPSQGGSYFYQTDDGRVVVMFGPKMRFWDYKDVRDHHCRRRAN